MYVVYKYAIRSIKMAQLLVRYYNIRIKQNYYLQRWFKILEIMIEKEKGARLGKIRTIQLIKVDLQMIMRIGLNI